MTSISSSSPHTLARLESLGRNLLLLQALWLGACSSCGEEVVTTPPLPITPEDMSRPDMQQVMMDTGPEAPEAARIEFSQETASIEIGKELAFTFEVFDASGEPLEELPFLMWSSSDRGVARAIPFSEERRAIIETTSIGTSTIAAQTLNGTRATLEVTVTPRVPVRIDITPDQATVTQRDTVQLVAKIFAEDDFELLDREPSWESSDDDIATVNVAGLVTGQRPGMAEVIATLDGLTTRVPITVTAREPDRVQVLSPPLQMLVNDTAVAEAVVRDDRGGVLDELPIAWSSDDDTVAEVDEDSGLVTAKREGQATLTASFAMLSATLDVTVANRPIASIDLTPDTDTLLLGESLQMNAIVFADDGSVHPVQAVNWSLQPAMSTSISVDMNGLVTALDTGTASVIATSVVAPEISSDPSIITVAANIDRIEVTPDTLSLIEGEQATVSATAYDQNNNTLLRQITWRSADPTIATVNINGDVQALMAGTTQIFAEADMISTPVTVTVSPVPIDRLEVSPSVVTLLPTDTAQFTAQAFDAQDMLLSGRAVSWQTSDMNVASVDAMTGVVTGVSAGRATITATSEGISATAAVVVPTLIKNVLAGGSHTCVLATDETYHCFGRNQFNVLGLMGSMDRLTPEQAPIPLESFAQISSLTLHQCAITPTNKLYCWGANFAGQLGIGSSTGSASSPTPIEASKDFDQVTAGGAHTCALESLTQETYCWGSNDYGQLGLQDFDQETSPVQLPGNLLFSTLSAGGSHTCGIEQGTQKLYCWGRNNAGQLGIANMFANVNTPTEVDNMRTYIAVSAGPDHTCAITTTGQTYCWGGNSDGQLGVDTGGADSVTHQLVPGNLDLVSVDAASLHTCGLTGTGAMYCWGANNNGQLGDGTTTSSAQPVAVSGGLTFTTMDLGGIHTCALTDTQIAYCWGSGSNGRLGNSSLAGSTVPFPITLGSP